MHFEYSEVRFTYSSVRPRHVNTILIGSFTVAALFTWGGPHAAAALLMSRAAPHTGQWERIYAALPTSWKTKEDIRVREVSDGDMDRLVAETMGAEDNRANDDSVVDGCYQGADEEQIDPPTITLRSSLTGEKASLIFTHEYGHFIWERMVRSNEQTRFTRLWSEQKRKHHLITEYATESVEEGFAEDFAYFIRKPATLRRRDLLAHQFLNALLTSGTLSQIETRDTVEVSR